MTRRRLLAVSLVGITAVAMAAVFAAAQPREPADPRPEWCDEYEAYLAWESEYAHLPPKRRQSAPNTTYTTGLMAVSQR